ncbi:hypothetical protein LINPERHAP1_LOCUS40713 [Linum perenne]
MMIMATLPHYTTPSTSFIMNGRCKFHTFIRISVIMLLTI